MLIAMHDFFANAKFILTPGGIPLPDGESTPPMSAIMRSFGEADIIPFAAPASAGRKLRARSIRARSRRRSPSSAL